MQIIVSDYSSLRKTGYFPFFVEFFFLANAELVGVLTEPSEFSTTHLSENADMKDKINHAGVSRLYSATFLDGDIDIPSVI